ncbi:MAG: hypothetical protein LC798_13025 [Chloroflexi bacterium]|nr:hypothetical protein [Chloroflexota bacterium]
MGGQKREEHREQTITESQVGSDDGLNDAEGAEGADLPGDAQEGEDEEDAE